VKDKQFKRRMDMALRITKAYETIEVKRIVTTIYGNPGQGKTSLAFTADTPLLIDFDGGAHRAIGRTDCVMVERWADASSISEADLKPFKTVVIDTVGKALEILAMSIIEDNPKMGRNGAPTLQGYGAVKAQFGAWIKSICLLGIDVVMIAHCTEKQQGDDIIERIDAMGGSKDTISQLSDMMGRVTIRGNKRLLLFSPTETSFGKNPAQFGQLEVPDFLNVDTPKNYFGGVIQDTKDHLNKMSAESLEVQAIVDEWVIKFTDCLSADEFNGLMKSVKKVDDRCALNVKRIMVKMASEKNIAFDQTKAVFTDEA
jgi:hypothetical protein